MGDTYDDAMVKAVAMADRLGREVEVRKNAFGEYDVSIALFYSEKGQTVRPGEPLTARQIEIRDRKGAAP